jgi:hypothetical protein
MATEATWQPHEKHGRLTKQSDLPDRVFSQQSMENREYVRRLLKVKQPEFSAALELAADLVGRELRSRETQRASEVSSPVTLRRQGPRTSPRPSPAIAASHRQPGCMTTGPAAAVAHLHNVTGQPESRH